MLPSGPSNPRDHPGSFSLVWVKPRGTPPQSTGRCVFLPIRRPVPMPTLAEGDLIEVRYEGVLAPYTLRWNNVHHLRCTGGTLSSGLSDFEGLGSLAEVMHALYEAQLLPHLSGDCFLQLTRCKRIKPTASVFGLYRESIAGGQGGNVDEPDDAMVITKRTEAPGKRGLGRNYICGVPDTRVDSGVISPTYMPDYANGAKQVFGAEVSATGLTYIGVVYSATALAAGGTLVAASPEVELVEADGIMRRMSRREIEGRTAYTGEIV